MVRSPPSQGEDRGSIPRQSTKQNDSHMSHEGVLWPTYESKSTYGVIGSTAPPQVESQVMLALYGKADASSKLAEWSFTYPFNPARQELVFARGQ
jgi:hypothetical protein